MAKSGIVLIDGSSSYTFSKDGSFTSAPLSASGRTFEGKWEIIEGKSEGAATVVVEAKEGWRDGIQPGNSFRRIVFVICPGETVPYIREDDPTGQLAIMARDPKAYFKCYWFIDEMTKTRSLSPGTDEKKPNKPPLPAGKSSTDPTTSTPP